MRAGVTVSTAEPKPGAPMTRMGKPKFARLRRLKNSVRKISTRLSVNLKRLLGAKSRLTKLSPRAVLRPTPPLRKMNRVRPSEVSVEMKSVA